MGQPSARDWAAAQRFFLRQEFPGFKVRAHIGGILARGAVQPNPEGALYTLVMTHAQGCEPEVTVETPALHPDAPHLYPSGQLCLYHPRLYQGARLGPLNRTVRLACAWLDWYEGWLRFGLWLGPSAPH